ncbi:hypothetical protein HPB49_010751 [Dermacentor silvarum]|uniref:Uncharacterized protein n=1 Tax=Dermacentor silvarum TaxID=543639 RepID=A0ACB8DYP5_DERSI|nr:hypothetical protein HPB49_010751 [Dermacentor silvarum]
MAYQQSKETERTQSSKAASADGTQARKTASAPSVPSEVDGTAAARLRIRPLPRLPVDDFKIGYHPTAGVNLAQYNDGELRAAVLANSGCRGGPHVHQPAQEYLHGIDFLHRPSCQLRQNQRPTLRGNKLAFHAYIALPDGAGPGIIYRAWSGESPQNLLRELRRANPLLPIVQARDMGRTARSVLIHFMAEELPPSVKMFGILYAVFNFRPKVEACLNCRQVGHRRDVCPVPNGLICPGCGQKHPADHPCTPECVVCGNAHMTGDRACKKRFQRGNSHPSRPRQTQQQQQKQQQHEFQLEKESFPRIEDRNRGSGSKSPGRSESCSRDPRSQSGKVSWAEQAFRSSRAHSESRENSKPQETIERLTRENQELKQQLALVLEGLSTLTAPPPHRPLRPYLSPPPPRSLIWQPNQRPIPHIPFPNPQKRKERNHPNPRMRTPNARVKKSVKNTGN